MLSVLPHILAKKEQFLPSLYLLCFICKVSQRDILKAVKHFSIAIFLIYKILSEEVTKILML